VQVPHNEGVANHVVPESCAVRREAQREALTGVSIGQPLSRERTLIPSADAVYSAEGHTVDALSRVSPGSAWSKTLACRYAFCAGTGRSPAWPSRDIAAVRVGKAMSRKPTMHEQEKSDLFVVATKRTNTTQGAAGGVRRAKEEGRGEHVRLEHAPDSEPGKRVPASRACTRKRVSVSAFTQGGSPVR